MNKSRVQSLRKIGKVLLQCNTVIGLYTSMILMYVFLWLKVEEPVVVCSIIASVFFLIRLVYRKRYLKRGQTIVLKHLDYKSDQAIQGDNLGDIAALILYSFLCILEIPDVTTKVGGWIGVFLLCSSTYFAIAAVSIRVNSILLKIATLTISTFQGFLCVLLFAAYLCLCLVSVLEGSIISIDNLQFSEGYIVELLVIAGAYTLETVPFFTLVPMMVSMLLYIIYISNTPIYQLEKMKIAYNVVNVFVTLVGIFAFFFSKYFEAIIVKNMEAIINSDDGIDFIREMPNAVKYLENFGESNINNLFYLLILPYTFGILVANMCVEKKERKAEEKRKEILKKLYSLEFCCEEKIVELKKEFLYWGGNLLECDVYMQLGKMNRLQKEKEEMTE